LLKHPRFPLFARKRFDHHRHKAVACTTKFVALAIIDAWLFDREQALVQTARNRVQLEPQDATPNEWITSAAVVWRRNGVFAGTTIRLSTAS